MGNFGDCNQWHRCLICNFPSYHVPLVQFLLKLQMQDFRDSEKTARVQPHVQPFSSQVNAYLFFLEWISIKHTQKQNKHIWAIKTFVHQLMSQNNHQAQLLFYDFEIDFYCFAINNTPNIILHILIVIHFVIVAHQLNR